MYSWLRAFTAANTALAILLFLLDWLFMLHITSQIMPLVIHSLGGGHTHTHARTHTHTHILTSRTKAISTNKCTVFLVLIYITLFVCYFDTELCHFDILMYHVDTLGVKYVKSEDKIKFN